MLGCRALCLLLLSGCYAHGWPFDDKHMCPGHAYPVSPSDCAASQSLSMSVTVRASVVTSTPSRESLPTPTLTVAFQNLTSGPVHVTAYTVSGGPDRQRVVTSFDLAAGARTTRDLRAAAAFVNAKDLTVAVEAEP